MAESTQQISRGLDAIRRLRRIFLGILFGLLPVTAATMVFIERSGHWPALMLPFGLFFCGMYVQRRLHARKCPRCGQYFFVQSVSSDRYTPFSSISFPPQKRCQHCGLVLYGE